MVLLGCNVCLLHFHVNRPRLISLFNVLFLFMALSRGLRQGSVHAEMRPLRLPHSSANIGRRQGGERACAQRPCAIWRNQFKKQD